jgi:small-conductance mechanosensitive channel
MNAFEPLIDKLIAALPAAIAIVAGAIALNVLLGRALRLLADRTSVTTADVVPFRKVGRWLIATASVVLVLGVLGFDLGGIWAMLATLLGMIAIGFVAVWSILSNVLCTLIILLSRPFAVGDEIEVPSEAVRGRVVDLSLLYTTLRAEDGSYVQIPNNLFFQKVLKRRPGQANVSLTEQLHATQEARV